MSKADEIKQVREKDKEVSASLKYSGTWPKPFPKRKRAFYRALKRKEEWALKAPPINTLSWIFWWTYAPTVKELISEGLKLYERIKFSQCSNIFTQPYILGTEHGVVFGDKK